MLVPSHVEELDASVASADAQPVADLSPGAFVGRFEMTYYWLAWEDAYDGAKSETIYAAEDCEVLAVVDPDFGDALRLAPS